MKTAKLTQTELASRLGIKQSTVSQLLNPSSNPRLNTLRRLSKELGVSLEELAATYDNPDNCEGGEEL